MDPQHESDLSTTRWWPTEPQRDWQQLEVSPVDWLVIWNVNLGGGHDAFSVTNGYWGNHPFQPNAVAPERAWVWWADNVRPPAGWRNVGGLGGIISLIGATSRGIPIRSGVVLVPTGDTVDELVDLARAVDDSVARHGGGWCPALVGDRERPRYGISVQRTRYQEAAFEAAISVGIDDVVTVDPFGDRKSWSTGDPEILVRGRLDGTTRSARPGRTASAYVDVPPAVAALQDRG